MLTSSCLCNDTLLAHPSAQQHLAQRVVDLVGACVVQVFSLEVNFTAATILAAHKKQTCEGKLMGPVSV